MSTFQDAFISYGRADSRNFAAHLNQRLTEERLEVWFDFDDIPLGVDYQKQIDQGINKTDNFLFIISPHSVNSSYCTLETKLALARNKRIIPLLHVEEISRETWQQRHPQGTDDDWIAYRAAGKHSSFPNMHPVISKINWVYFREGIDDFEQSFQGLLDIFRRDQDYVRQHNVFLNQAIAWEQDHKPVRALLVEEELEKARVWLHTQFSDRQPPCDPTYLHCQFISESLKHAQSGMTEVFLSHAEEDRDILETVYNALTRAGLTVWTSWQDIQTGMDFKEAIAQGIETADNVVYLISPDALRSPWCEYEINYALSLNKRIIPVLIKSVDLEAIPDNLKSLQFINLTGDSTPSKYFLEGSNLLGAVSQDADYYKAHKFLLVKALKWERQLHNPCVLMQGYTLRQTEAWLKVAQKHARHRPLPIQEEFVQESLAQPIDTRLSVFIAHTGKDLDFARKLSETLQIQGERTWFEPDKIALGADYGKEMQAGIERAENFVFIASAEALADEALMAELRMAERFSKRIITVVYRDREYDNLPPVLRESPCIDFSVQGEDFLNNFGILYRILKSHPQHIRDHTRLLIRAVEWQQSGQDDSTLLRGKELIKAEQWLEQAKNQTPKPSDLQKEYLQASRALSFRKVKPWSVLGLGVGSTIFVVAVRLFGLLQGLEMPAYDHLLRHRPNEAQDDRFLIVTVDERSGSFIRDGLIEERYEPGIGTLPDDALNDVIAVLTRNEARLIGLDFYRDFPAKPVVAGTLKETDNLITVCKASYEGKGVLAPYDVPLERVGFSDLLSEPQGGATFVRRHYLMQAADPEFCPTSTSLSLALASRYLEQEGVTFTNPATPEGGFAGNGLRFDDLVVPNLSLLRGPYYMAPSAFGGYQTLLNFRTAPNTENGGIAKDPNNFAPTVSLEELLTGKVPKDLIQDRIVLIGYTDSADRNADFWETPYGEMPGVFLQGQMTSQIISAVLDERSLIRWWSIGKELLWIFAWAIAGGVIVRQVIRLPALAAALMIGSAALYGSCYVALAYNALWIPLVPPLATFALTAGGVAILNYRLRQP